jgi:hypothetical protein
MTREGILAAPATAIGALCASWYPIAKRREALELIDDRNRTASSWR